MKNFGEGAPAADLRVKEWNEGFQWGVGAGFALGLCTALIVFVGSTCLVSR